MPDRTAVRCLGPARALLLSLTAAAAALGILAPLHAGAASGAAGRVDGSLLDLARDHPSQSVRVLVQAMHPQEADDAARATGATVHAHLPNVGSIALEIRADQVNALAQQPGVRRVALDAPVRSLGQPAVAGAPTSVFAASVGATQLWSAGVTGAGIAIAVVDSGVKPVPDFGNRIVVNQRFNQGAASTADQEGHGTWVAGLVAGDGSSSGGLYPGVAPGASLINLKVSDDEGRAYTSDVIAALGWAVAHRAQTNLRVVNLSLLSNASESYSTSLLDAAVEIAWHSGLVVVAAAGNGGTAGITAAPANDPYVLTVGAADDQGTVTPTDDLLAWFSALGPTSDGMAKPDLVAPGRHLVGPLSDVGATLARAFPTKVVSHSYIQLSGTSGSTAVVSGAVALLLQRHPSLTPNQVKWLLMNTARPIGGNTRGLGSGEIDVARAVAYQGVMGSANQGLTPNLLVAQAYQATANVQSSADGNGAVSWDSVSWDSVSWDSVSWDSVALGSVSWDSVSWDSVLGD